jgi:hypothetical protein
MQLINELRYQIGEAKEFVFKLPAFFRRNVWTALLAFSFFAAGWLAGSVRGSQDSIESMTDIGAIMSTVMAAERARGESGMSDVFYRRQIDSKVEEYVALNDAPINTKLWRMLSMREALSGAPPLNVRSLRELAEQRIQLLNPARPDTIKAMIGVGMEDRLNTQIAMADRTARAYSALLGREIRGDQLLADFELRGLIQIELNDRKFRQQQ